MRERNNHDRCADALGPTETGGMAVAARSTHLAKQSLGGACVLKVGRAVAMQRSLVRSCPFQKN